MTVTVRSRRVPLMGATLAAAALFAAGCGSSSPSPSSPPPSSPPSSAATTGPASSAPASPASATPTVSPAGGGATSSSGSGGTAGSGGTSASGGSACATSNLRVTVGGRQGTAGSVYTTIDFTNAGSGTCTLYGYPGVSLVNSSGRQVGAAATRNHMRAPKLVRISPGGKANAVVQITDAGNYPGSTCGQAPASSLRVYPPGETHSVTVPYQTTGCSKGTVKLLSVTTVSSGTG